MPRDPRGLLRGLSEPWVIPETGVRGWLTPTPSGRVSDRTALLLLCATDTEVLATRASWRSEQQWPGFASRRISPKNRKKEKLAVATDGQWTVSNIKQRSDDQIRRSQRSAADKALGPLGSALHYQAHESF